MNSISLLHQLIVLFHNDGSVIVGVTLPWTILDLLVMQNVSSVEFVFKTVQLQGFVHVNYINWTLSSNPANAITSITLLLLANALKL